MARKPGGLRAGRAAKRRDSEAEKPGDEVMMKTTNKPLKETLTVFEQAGLDPEVRHGRKHLKVVRNILAVVGAIPSDGRAGVNARAVARRLIREPEERHAGKAAGDRRTPAQTPQQSNAGRAHVPSLPRPKGSERQTKGARLLVEQRNAELAAQREDRRNRAIELRDVNLVKEKTEREALQAAKEEERLRPPVIHIERKVVSAIEVEEKHQAKRIAKEQRDKARQMEAERALAAHLDNWLKMELRAYRFLAAALGRAAVLKLECMSLMKI